MVNIQGVNSSQDTHTCDFQQAFDAAIEVTL
jgi:hypothetical protein